MHNKDNAYTLAEMIVVISIIGFLFLASLSVVKHQVQDYKLQYITAYNAISRAYYNGYLSAGHNPFTNVPADSVIHTDTKDTGTEILCRALTSYINTTNNNITSDYDNDCSATKITSQIASTFEDTKVQFRAFNGMKFYLSNLIAADTDFPFYLIFVDLNGDKAPNSILKDKKNPDIVAFAALNTGRVVPIGRPEFDTTYMTARLTYNNNFGNAVYSGNSKAYYQAKGAAWGFYSSDTVNVLTDVNPNDHFTLNDIIRSNIDSDSNILKDFPNLTELSPHTVESEEPTSCSEKDFETCYISIDEYKY